MHLRRSCRHFRFLVPGFLLAAGVLSTPLLRAAEPGPTDRARFVLDMVFDNPGEPPQPSAFCVRP